MKVTKLTPAEREVLGILSEYKRLDEAMMQGYNDALTSDLGTPYDELISRADAWLEGRKQKNIQRTLAKLKPLIDQIV